MGYYKVPLSFMIDVPTSSLAYLMGFTTLPGNVLIKKCVTRVLMKLLVDFSSKRASLVTNHCQDFSVIR